MSRRRQQKERRTLRCDSDDRLALLALRRAHISTVAEGHLELEIKFVAEYQVSWEYIAKTGPLTRAELTKWPERRAVAEAVMSPGVGREAE